MLLICYVNGKKAYLAKSDEYANLCLNYEHEYQNYVYVMRRNVVCMYRPRSKGLGLLRIT